MNRTEAANIVGYLNRAGLVGAMEGQAAVWADALEDVSYTTAQDVVRGMAKSRTSGQRWVTPGDVAAEVTRLRKERTERMEVPQPPAELEDARDWIRAFWTAIGDGLTKDEAELVACKSVGVQPKPIAMVKRPVEQIVESTARRLPRIPRDGAA